MQQYKIEDLKEFKRNALEILRRNSQYATATATEEAFDILIDLTKIQEKMDKYLNDAYFAKVGGLNG